MQDAQSQEWLDHYNRTKNYPPAPLLIEAVNYVQNKGHAIDIGAGATLKDSLYLVSQGFDVTALDKEVAVELAVKEIGSEHLEACISKFADFDFRENRYDLATANYSLPFTEPKMFGAIFEKIKNSLVPGGIFCGQFFGGHDAWHTNKNLTFLSKDNAMAMLDGMEIILFKEKEFDGKTADGNPKHWHVFDIIARKK